MTNIWSRRHEYGHTSGGFTSAKGVNARYQEPRTLSPPGELLLAAYAPGWLPAQPCGARPLTVDGVVEGRPERRPARSPGATLSGCCHLRLSCNGT